MLPKFMPKRLKTPAGEILLREAQRKDLAALNRIINEPEVNKFVLGPAPVSMQSTAGHYLERKHSGDPWIVCIFQGNVVGSVDLKPKFGRESHVSEFGIAFSKKVHGKGIAEAGVRHCFSWLAKKGIEKIVSGVLSDNKKARAFYKKIGFEELCTLKGNCKRGKSYADVLVIEKFL
jgi:RimJ/RimL family protein N-acetyltransferase